MKRFTLLSLSLLVAILMLAADKNGRFFLRFHGEQIAVETAVDNFSHWFSLPPETEWREVSRSVDRAGMERIVYRQYVGGVEVERSQVILHAKNGLVRSANGTVMEARRTPAKLHKPTAGRNEAPRAAANKELLLVNTSDGYRYAYKVFSAPTNEWVFYDAETGEVIKRVPVRHNFDVPTGSSSQTTVKSIYSGDVTLDVFKGDDGQTYLYDPARNIHTLSGAFFASNSDLAEQGKLYDYFPQGNMPDNPEDATEGEWYEWRAFVMEKADNNELEHFGDYIKDFSSYITSADGNFGAFMLNSLSVSRLTVEDEDGDLIDLLPLDDDADELPNVKFSLRYGSTDDMEKAGNGALGDMEIGLDDLAGTCDLTELSRIVPKDGTTIIVSLTEGDDYDDYDDDEDSGYNIRRLGDDDDDDDGDDEPYYGKEDEVIAVVSFTPDASGKFEFQNDRIAFTFTYQPAGDPTADVHWGMGKTLDFYDEVFDRKSYDGNGSPVYNIIYVPDDETDFFLATPTNNAGALASQEPYPMVYGMGGVDPFGGTVMKPVVEITVMAHEFTHIITGVTANLEYQGESGALNESFSDIMGISVKKYIFDTADWNIGEDVLIGYTNLRDMADPKNSMDGEDPAPDTYGGENWVDPVGDDDGDNGGVHTNSSVQNKWYFLLTDGGSGTNDNDYDYDMAGIGIEKSRQIAYLTLTSYASEQTDYAAISEASIEAAGVLYGENGTEVNAVIDAWKAVGVLDPDYSAGIQNVTVDETVGNYYYDLLGRRLGGKPATRGIYVKNGKKVIIKG